MRVLLINDHVHLSGGGDVVLDSERCFLKGCGYDVFLFGWSSNTHSNDDHVILCKEGNSSLSRYYYKFVGSRKMRAFFRKTLSIIKPDIIHIHLVSKYPLSIYPELIGYKVIQTLHGPNLFCATSWGCIKCNSTPCSMGIGVKCYRNRCMSLAGTLAYTFMNRRINKYLKTSITCWHCPSRNIYNIAFSLGYSNLVYIPLGIDKQYEEERDVCCNKVDNNILFVGAASVAKGLGYLYEAFKIVQRSIPNARLIIAGSGEFVTLLQKMVERDKNEKHVELLGRVPHESIRLLYRRASVFVMPSIWQEQFGLVGPEALAMGIPVVGSNIGGIPEWLHHNEWGYLVAPRDVREMARRIVYLLSHREQSYLMGQKGRYFVLQEYSHQNYVERMKQLIDSVYDGDKVFQFDC